MVVFTGCMAKPKRTCDGMIDPITFVGDGLWNDLEQFKTTFENSLDDGSWILPYFPDFFQGFGP